MYFSRVNYLVKCVDRNFGKTNLVNMWKLAPPTSDASRHLMTDIISRTNCLFQLGNYLTLLTEVQHYRTDHFDPVISDSGK